MLALSLSACDNTKVQYNDCRHILSTAQTARDSVTLLTYLSKCHEAIDYDQNPREPSTITVNQPKP